MSFQLIPLLTMDLVGQYPGLPGLVISCIFSGSLRYYIIEFLVLSLVLSYLMNSLAVMHFCDIWNILFYLSSGDSSDFL